MSLKWIKITVGGLALFWLAGAAALVIASGTVSDTNNGRINDEVRAKLDSTATNLGVAGKDAQYGYGLVNAAAAVAQ